MFNITVIFLIIQCLLKSPNNTLGCGLVGASSPRGVKLNNMLLKTLLLYNEKRGDDSSGFWPNSDNEITRAVGPVSENILPFTELNNLENEIFIGHTRSKTFGAISKENAHPFKFEEGNRFIIGAHNGTLSNWEALRQYYEYDHDIVNMDSKFIFYHRLRSEETNWKVFREIGGAAAVIFTEDGETLKVWRNKDTNSRFERPLFRGTLKVEGVQQMYISSIEDSLLAIGCVSIKEFKQEYLYTIKEGKVINSQLVRNNSLSSYQIEQLIRKNNPEPDEENKNKHLSKKERRRQQIKERNIENFNREPFSHTPYRSSFDDLNDEDRDDMSSACAFRRVGEHEAEIRALENLDNVSEDNYVWKESEDGNVEENVLDDASVDILKSSLDSLPKLEVKNDIIASSDLIKSEMSVERSYLIMEALSLFLTNLSSKIKEMDSKVLAEEKEHLAGLLDGYGEDVQQQMFNLIIDSKS
jgi:hypothetical protein